MQFWNILFDIISYQLLIAFFSLIQMTLYSLLTKFSISFNETALHIAIKKENIEANKLLLENKNTNVDYFQISNY